MSDSKKQCFPISRAAISSNPVDKILFELHCKVGQLYKTGNNTFKILEKEWRQVEPEGYEVWLTWEAATEPGLGRKDVYLDPQMVPNVMIGDFIDQGGRRFCVSSIFWDLKPGNAAEVYLYVVGA